MKFIDTKLNKNIIKAIDEIGYKDLTKIQEKTLNYILDKKDVIAMASTGSGKTAAFLLPLINNVDILNKQSQVLIVTPTRELAIQIFNEANKFCRYVKEIKISAVYGGRDIIKQISSIRNKTNIIVGTPGRILDIFKRKQINLKNISSVVLDEADQMLSMGFYKDVKKILTYLNQDIQKLLFSATIDKRVKLVADEIMKDAIYIECKDNDTMLVDNIFQIAINVKEKFKNQCILRILQKEKAKNSIVFCNTKKETTNLYKFLLSNSLKVEMLNSDVEQAQREKVIEKLKNGKLDTIVVTDVLSRGIDINDLELVINYDIPIEVESYVHRVGRTARRGNSGVAYTLYTGKQIEKIKEIEQYTHTKMHYQDVPIISKEISGNYPISKRGLYIVTFSLGKKDGIKVKDIVGAISALVGINSSNIGIIEVYEDKTTVEVAKEYLYEIERAFENGSIKGKRVKII